MKFISHRGNIDKIVESEENYPDKILHCINQGYDVEIDVWYNVEKHKLYLGHDEPQHAITQDFLLNNSDKLWCHAKNIDALKRLLDLGVLNCFWHQKDSYTLTSKGVIWVYPGEPLIQNSVALIMDESKGKYYLRDLQTCYGICSDNIQHFKKLI